MSRGAGDGRGGRGRGMPSLVETKYTRMPSPPPEQPQQVGQPMDISGRGRSGGRISVTRGIPRGGSHPPQQAIPHQVPYQQQPPIRDTELISPVPPAPDQPSVPRGTSAVGSRYQAYRQMTLGAERETPPPSLQQHQQSAITPVRPTPSPQQQQTTPYMPVPSPQQQTTPYMPAPSPQQQTTPYVPAPPPPTPAHPGIVYQSPQQRPPTPYGRPPTPGAFNPEAQPYVPVETYHPVMASQQPVQPLGPQQPVQPPPSHLYQPVPTGPPVQPSQHYQPVPTGPPVQPSQYYQPVPTGPPVQPSQHYQPVPAVPPSYEHPMLPIEQVVMRERQNWRRTGTGEDVAQQEQALVPAQEQTIQSQGPPVQEQQGLQQMVQRQQDFSVSRAGTGGAVAQQEQALVPGGAVAQQEQALVPTQEQIIQSQALGRVVFTAVSQMADLFGRLAQDLSVTLPAEPGNGPSTSNGTGLPGANGHGPPGSGANGSGPPGGNSSGQGGGGLSS